MFGWFRKRQAMSPHPPSPIEPVCFVCGGSPPAFDRDSPGQWLSPRCACRDHCDAALLSSGEPLSEFLGRRGGDHPLEGSGLGWLLNPVSIAGTRAWADFAGGGWAVLEEVFESAGQFDFWAQHRPDCVDALYRLYPPAGTRVTRLVPNEAGGWPLSRSILAQQWEFHRRVEDGFRRRGTRDFKSPAELLEFWSSLHHAGEWPTPGDGSEFDRHLCALAGRRFQRIAETRRTG